MYVSSTQAMFHRQTEIIRQKLRKPLNLQWNPTRRFRNNVEKKLLERYQTVTCLILVPKNISCFLHCKINYRRQKISCSMTVTLHCVKSLYRKKRFLDNYIHNILRWFSILIAMSDYLLYFSGILTFDSNYIGLSILSLHFSLVKTKYRISKKKKSIKETKSTSHHTS